MVDDADRRVGGGALGAIGTYLVSSKELRLRQRTETIDRFMKVAAIAHGNQDDRERTVGMGEQVAAIFLLADLANRDDWLRKAGISFLDETAVWLEKDDTTPAAARLVAAVHEARALIKEHSP